LPERGKTENVRRPTAKIGQKTGPGVLHNMTLLTIYGH